MRGVTRYELSFMDQCNPHVRHFVPYLKADFLLKLDSFPLGFVLARGHGWRLHDKLRVNELGVELHLSYGAALQFLSQVVFHLLAFAWGWLWARYLKKTGRSLFNFWWLGIIAT